MVTVPSQPRSWARSWGQNPTEAELQDMSNEVELKNKKQQQEDAYELERVNAKAGKQLKNYAVHRTYNKVAPLVAQRLEQQLKQTFSDEAEGHAYINSVLDDLGSLWKEMNSF